MRRASCLWLLRRYGRLYIEALGNVSNPVLSAAAQRRVQLLMLALRTQQHDALTGDELTVEILPYRWRPAWRHGCAPSKREAGPRSTLFARRVRIAALVCRCIVPPSVPLNGSRREPAHEALWGEFLGGGGIDSCGQN